MIRRIRQMSTIVLAMTVLSSVANATEINAVPTPLRNRVNHRASRRTQQQKRQQQQQQQEGPPCSCSPRSYTFQLLYNDCDSSTLQPNSSDNGIRNLNCRINAVTDTTTRQLSQRQRELPSHKERSKSGGGAGSAKVNNGGSADGGDGYGENDTDDDIYFDRFQSQLHSSLLDLVKLTRQANDDDANQEDAGGDDDGGDDSSLIPAYVSSINFFEFDASGTLTVINQDDTYANMTNRLTNGTIVTYDSISQRLDVSKPLGEQLEYVPGGAGLFAFGNNEEGELIVRGSLFWEFGEDCNVVPRLVGETLGWIKFEDTTPASRAFCPAILSSAPTAEPTNEAVETTSPTPPPSARPVTDEPTVDAETKSPTLSPESTNAPSDRPATAEPTDGEPVVTDSPTAASTFKKSELTKKPTNSPPSSGPVTTPEPTILLTKKPVIIRPTTPAPIVGPALTPSPSVAVTPTPSTKNPTPSMPTHAPTIGKSAKSSKSAKTTKSGKALFSKSKSSKSELEIMVVDAKAKSTKERPNETKSAKPFYEAKAKGVKYASSSKGGKTASHDTTAAANLVVVGVPKTTKVPKEGITKASKIFKSGFDSTTTSKASKKGQNYEKNTFRIFQKRRSSLRNRTDDGDGGRQLAEEGRRRRV